MIQGRDRRDYAELAPTKFRRPPYLPSLRLVGDYLSNEGPAERGLALPVPNLAGHGQIGEIGIARWMVGLDPGHAE